MKCIALAETDCFIYFHLVKISFSLKNPSSDQQESYTGYYRNLDPLVFKMPENHFRYNSFGNRDSLDRVIFGTKTQERGYLRSRARENSCGLQWACAHRSSARQSCVMATDQESNNLDDFDIEQVINWEEHNYASKVC